MAKSARPQLHFLSQHTLTQKLHTNTGLHKTISENAYFERQYKRRPQIWQARED